MIFQSDSRYSPAVRMSDFQSEDSGSNPDIDFLFFVFVIMNAFIYLNISVHFNYTIPNLVAMMPDI